MPRVQFDLSSKRARLPEHHVPTERELIVLLQEHPGITLRQLSALIWPGLPWSAALFGGDSATGRMREWPVPPGTQRATAALWLRDRLEALVTAGLARHGARRRDEVDALASLTYLPA
jgi:hypothetical protein